MAGDRVGCLPLKAIGGGRLRNRIDDLLDGADVLVYRFELGDFAPPRDGHHVFTLRGDRLVPAEYERVVPIGSIPP